MPVVPSADPTYVTVGAVRALPNLSDEELFPDADIVQAIHWFEEVFEEFTGMAFLPRQATERLDGRCSTVMLNHWPVRSITAVRSYTSPATYTEFTADELADLKVDPTGEIKRYSLGSWPGDVELDYVHGQAEPGESIQREALVAIQEKLMERTSGRPTDRTYGVATDGVFVRSILPDGDKHPFGIASVDALAVRMRAKYKLPGIG